MNGIQMFEENVYSLEGNLHYLKRYVKFIRACMISNDDLEPATYIERHHILPGSLFPEYYNSDWNIIALTARQHFIAHWILAKAYGGVMWYALNMMNTCREQGNRDYKFSSSLYERLKKEHSKLISERMRGEGNYWFGKDRSGPKNPMFGKKHSAGSKDIMSKKAKKRFEDEEYRMRFVGENNGMYGRTHTDEYKQKLRERMTNNPNHPGKNKSEETRKRISESKKGKPLSESHKESLSRAGKGKKKNAGHGKKIAESRKGTKRVYRKDGSFRYVKKELLHNFTFKDGKYYDY